MLPLNKRIKNRDEALERTRKMMDQLKLEEALQELEGAIRWQKTLSGK